jgi:hypothetical protein
LAGENPTINTVDWHTIDGSAVVLGDSTMQLAPTRLILCSSLLTLAIICSPLVGQAACPWSGVQAPSSVAGVDGSVRALEVFDFNGSTSLYAAGRFQNADGSLVNNIAEWNGASWSALGPGLTGTNAAVNALAVWDDGSGPALYAGGTFASAGILPVDNIAKWDGMNWSAVGAGLTGLFGTAAHASVEALAVFNGELYAGGSFATAGAVTATCLARWNGSAWSALGTAPDEGITNVFTPGLVPVQALLPHNDGSGPALYAAGAFYINHSTVYSGLVAKWDGAAWSAANLSGSSMLRVSSLGAYDAGAGLLLFAGGDQIAKAGPQSPTRIWPPYRWPPLTTVMASPFSSAGSSTASPL